MKVLYSQLKQLVPGLRANLKEIGEKFTMAGLMIDGLAPVKFNGKSDWLFGFEVRQNRPDCLGIIGLAREAAAYYGLKLVLPKINIKLPVVGNQEIKVKAEKQVKRALALEIQGVKNRPSPSWLKEFLALYDINPINLLVDLSNYAMLLTGYPSHLLDKDKMKGGLSWGINHAFKNIITLDGTLINLSGKEIILQDNSQILGLAGIVGGKKAAIETGTKNIIAEMAIYDRALIRQNSRELKTTTEASGRLDKDLSPVGLDYAFKFLISLILKEAGGQVAGKLFSYYPKQQVLPKISFNPESPSIFSGIKISEVQGLKILKRLGFIIKKSAKTWLVTPPACRTDIAIAEDVIEEVIRVFGFEKIPTNQAPAFKPVVDITPKIIRVEDKINEAITALGFDEIRSWPLTTKEINQGVNWLDWENIATENSVNEEYPDLRQSMAASLLSQLSEYKKKNISKIKIFEMGRIFGKKQEKFLEKESLGIMIRKEKAGDLNELKATIDILLRFLGLSAINYQASKIRPAAAEPYSCWDIFCQGRLLGILYKLKNEKETGLAEIDLSETIKTLIGSALNPAVELEQKIIILDANVETKGDINNFLTQAENKIGKKNIWAIEIIDKFKSKYTLRVHYKGLSDQEAKKIHLRTFNLKI